MFKKTTDKKLTPCVCGKLPIICSFLPKKVCNSTAAFWLVQCGNPYCKYQPGSGIQFSKKQAIDKWDETIKKWGAIENDGSQMNNGNQIDKEVQDIANIICCADNDDNTQCADCGIPVDGKINDCPYLPGAKALYNAGYRKAEDVRKETAEEILQDFYDQTFEMKDPYNGDVDEQKEVIDRGDILNMAEHFNIKVDE